MRHYKTAKTILKKSLEDIEAGNWKKGYLAVVPQYAANGDYIGDGIELLDEGKTCDVHTGCAIGLVAMHGGVGRDLKGGYFAPEYPSEAREVPAGVEQAIRLLFHALSRQKKNQALSDAGALSYEELPLEVLEAAVYNHNDSRSTTQKRAAQWFAKALAAA